MVLIPSGDNCFLIYDHNPPCYSCEHDDPGDDPAEGRGHVHNDRNDVRIFCSNYGYG